jgi:predicted nucleotidyltransferase component of viral defense system
MARIKENTNCYTSSAQRKILIQLITHPDIEKNFFLTGGTALSVFYLHHRLSDDLDFFTKDFSNFAAIDFWIKTNWPKQNVKIKEAGQFLSLLIEDVKVDFVLDPLSIEEKRERYKYENGHYLSVDTLNNIVSNKLCTLVSRTEPKDYIDFYMILKSYPTIEINDVYQKSRLKDAIFDDPPTAAFQLETGITFLKENPVIMPRMLIQIDMPDFYEFYGNLSKWLYNLFKNGS